MTKLNKIQRAKLPPELRVVLERFHHEPQLLMKLKQLLSIDAQKIMQDSINHSSFCDRFQTPQRLPNQLLELYGTTAKELKVAMRKIGFDERNDMYDSSYYQSFCVAYLIGLEFGDENIRKLALLMIAIRVWNGRKFKAFPKYCDPDIARYVLNYVLRGNHTLKKAGSAFEYIDGFNIPHIDKAYKDSIADNLNDDRKGLRKLIETEYSRFSQLFRSMRIAYYNTHAEGKKEITSDKYGQQYGDGDMVESKESFTSNIERIIDKIEKNSMLKKNVIIKPESVKLLKERFNISEDGIRKINNWIEDDENSDELRYFYELVFTAMKVRTETDICQFDVVTLAYKVTAAKKDKNLLKAKEVLDHVLKEVLSSRYNTLGKANIYRLKNMIAFAFMIYAKSMFCKKL
jgi:hypothetical protein